MKTWMRCPLAAKYKYVDNLREDENSAASFGKAIHTALDDYDHHEKLDQAKLRFGHEWEVAFPKIENWSRGTSFGGLRERGMKILEAYHEQMQWEDRNVLATEHYFLVRLGDYELHGYVDLVEMRKNDQGQHEIHIVDYKTNKRAPTKFNLAYDVQFTLYVYAAMQKEFWCGQQPEDPDALCDEEFWEQNIKGLPIVPIWYHLEGNKRIEVGLRTQDDFDRLHRCCDEIRKALEYDVYVPNISGDSCMFCSFKKPCGLPEVEAF
jgi:CRISPR/Cas system-associated exonuclease Cas4 (RecB family)